MRSAMDTGRYEKTISSGNKEWQRELISHLGIVDEGDIVSLIDLEERAEFDDRILDLLEREEDYGRGF